MKADASWPMLWTARYGNSRPTVPRKTERAAATETFEAFGREWLARPANTTASITQQKAKWLLEQIFIDIGSLPIHEFADLKLLAAEFPRLKTSRFPG